MTYKELEKLCEQNDVQLEFYAGEVEVYRLSANAGSKKIVEDYMYHTIGNYTQDFKERFYDGVWFEFVRQRYLASLTNIRK